MAFKLIHATQGKSGTTILVEGVACIIKSNDISKTGRHGHSKCRIEAVNLIDGKKKVFVIGGHDKLECPMINKRKAQVLSVSEDNANIMDLENFETIDVLISEELRGQIKEEDQVEYWDIEGTKIIKKKL